MSVLLKYTFKNIKTEATMTFSAYSEKSARELLALATDNPEDWELVES